LQSQDCSPFSIVASGSHAGLDPRGLQPDAPAADIQGRSPAMHDRHHARPIARPRAAARASRAPLGAGLAALSLMAGCAAVRLDAPRYVEPPATVATAKVRVVNTRAQVYYADIAVFDAPACLTRANLGMTGGESRDAERLGMLDDQPVSAATLERLVRAGEPLVLGPRVVFPTVSRREAMHALQADTQEDVRARRAGVCKMPAFVPKAGEQYEVMVDLSPARCTVTPYRLVGEGGAVKREPVESQSSRISTYEFDMKCFR
jgi:hypothetical protein